MIQSGKKNKSINNKYLDFSIYFDLNHIIFNYFDIKQNIDNETSNNYNLFLLFFMIKEKIMEKNFIINLEKSYGVYIDADNFIAKIKRVINQTKNINECNKILENYLERN